MPCRAYSRQSIFRLNTYVGLETFWIPLQDGKIIHFQDMIWCTLLVESYEMLDVPWLRELSPFQCLRDYTLSVGDIQLCGKVLPSWEIVFLRSEFKLPMLLSLAPTRPFWNRYVEYCVAFCWYIVILISTYSLLYSNRSRFSLMSSWASSLCFGSKCSTQKLLRPILVRITTFDVKAI